MVLDRFMKWGRFLKAAIISGLVLISAPAAAQDMFDEPAQDKTRHPSQEDLCSDRPGLNTSACTVDAGSLQIELGLVDWSLDKHVGEREDRIEAGQILLRYGVGETTEVRFGWTAYGQVRTRNVGSRQINTISGIGDVTLGLKQNLLHPFENEIGFAVALLPYVTLPTGHNQIGAGDWGGGLIIPSSYKLSDAISLELSPEINAAVNERGSGRHLAYGTAAGVQVLLTKTMHLTPEVQIVRDRDPADHRTMSNAALSFDIQVMKRMQIDIQAVAGLNQNTPDVELAFGITRKF